jgi:3-isopropylmalate dehydratase small subunit
MGLTLIEKILSSHTDTPAKAGNIVDIFIDARVARDFGGANVVKNIVDNNLDVRDPEKTFFTFDCNPGGSDQKYAENQHKCRLFAREKGIGLFDINQGIGTHIAKGLVFPGGTFVSTDSHANIMGAVAAFGQGMGDRDIAHAWAEGKTWFKVPPSRKIILEGMLSSSASAKDIVLFLLSKYGAAGLLGHAVEISGPAAAELTIDQRITIASMATEMGAITLLFEADEKTARFYMESTGRSIEFLRADEDAEYTGVDTFDISGIGPMISRPGHPDDAVPVSEAAGRPVDSVFIGSCTNGRYEDFVAAAAILKNRTTAPWVVLKMVPSTNDLWQRLLNEGIIDTLKQAGALIGNAGCAGCAAGQIGQNGPNEVTVSTGNRNFPGKQGKGEVYLASAATAAACAAAGRIITAAQLEELEQKGLELYDKALFSVSSDRGVKSNIKSNIKSGAKSEAKSHTPENAHKNAKAGEKGEKKEKGEAGLDKKCIFKGRVWKIDINNIDTDMIFHNRYLTITDIDQMGKYTFDNLQGWEDFAQKARPGDIVVTGSNFGCGSSRQQAVDCFKSLGISIIVAESFGAIYERNAINAGFPVLSAQIDFSRVKNNESVTVDFAGSVIEFESGYKIKGQPVADVQIEIYRRGDLLRGL